MRKFIIIGGMPRSGTNLTRRVIGSHSNIAIPPAEFMFLHRLAKGRSLDEVLSNHRLKQWNIDFSDLYAREPKDVYVQALLRYAESVGKEHTGEKTPLNEFYYDTLQEWLQDFELKFIHMVRNPFDVMASQKHMPERKNQTLDFAMHCRNWLRSVSMGLAREHSDPQGYTLLKYEDLTDDAASVTQKLCEFLGVDFEADRMLNLSDFSGYKDNTSFANPSNHNGKQDAPIRQSRSRKGHLTNEEQRLVASMCGELAHALGYIDEDFRLSRPETESFGFVGRLKRIARSRFA